MFTWPTNRRGSDATGSPITHVTTYALSCSIFDLARKRNAPKTGRQTKCQMSNDSFLAQSQQLPHARKLTDLQESDGHSVDITDREKLQKRPPTPNYCNWTLSSVSEGIARQE